jgi:hypothetical protein
MVSTTRWTAEGFNGVVHRKVSGQGEVMSDVDWPIAGFEQQGTLALFGTYHSIWVLSDAGIKA